VAAVRPAGACIRYGRRPIARIAAQPGAERLRGAHLRPILATTLDWSLLIVLALEEVQSERGTHPL